MKLLLFHILLLIVNNRSVQSFLFSFTLSVHAPNPPLVHTQRRMNQIYKVSNLFPETSFEQMSQRRAEQNGFSGGPMPKKMQKTYINGYFKQLAMIPKIEICADTDQGIEPGFFPPTSCNVWSLMNKNPVCLGN